VGEALLGIMEKMVMQVVAVAVLLVIMIMVGLVVQGRRVGTEGTVLFIVLIIIHQAAAVAVAVMVITP
jgi:hypothetical protein